MSVDRQIQQARQRRATRQQEAHHDVNVARHRGQEALQYLADQDAIAANVRGLYDSLARAGKTDDTRCGVRNQPMEVYLRRDFPADRPSAAETKMKILGIEIPSATSARRTTPGTAQFYTHTGLPVRYDDAPHRIPGETHLWAAPVFEEGVRVAGKGKRGMPSNRQVRRSAQPGHQIPYEPTGEITYVGLRLYVGKGDGDPSTMLQFAELGTPLVTPAERKIINDTLSSSQTAQADGGREVKWLDRMREADRQLMEIDQILAQMQQHSQANPNDTLVAPAPPPA